MVVWPSLNDYTPLVFMDISTVDMEDKDQVNIMAVDGLATQGARASTAMIVTYFFQE